MAASLAGVICDGAKTGRALKAGTASAMAIRGAILEGKNVEVPDDSGSATQEYLSLRQAGVHGFRSCGRAKRRRKVPQE